MEPVYDGGFGDLEVEQDGVKVELTYIGEGSCGEYDGSGDTPLLRFYVLKWNAAEQELEDVDDASYCTEIPATTDRDVLTHITKHILDSVCDDVRRGASIKKRCEELSWINPGDFKEEDHGTA